MHAIVLTFDKQIGFAELLYKKYAELWPGCPFNFRIAYNQKKNIPVSLKSAGNVEMVKTASDIRSTMASLLAGIPDDEWVYWCIDDRYPTFIDVERIQSVYEYTQTEEAESLNSIKLLNWNERHLKSKHPLEIGDRTFNFQVWRPPKHFWGFWHHRFAKAGTLKFIFLSDTLSQHYGIGDIQVFHSLENVEVQRNIVYPPGDFIIKLAEPCIRGTLTINGLEDLKKYDCEIPDYPIKNCVKSFINQTTPAVRGVTYIKTADAKYHVVINGEK